MRAIVKGIFLAQADVLLEDYQPHNSKCFGLWIDLNIGPDNEEGSNNYQLLVCTPEWLEITLRYEWNRAQWGRHMLIVLEYDLDLIKERVLSYVEGCTGKDFWEIAQKISKIAAWEFEDAQSDNWGQSKISAPDL